MRLASLWLLVMLAGSAVAATLYRWVDADGVIHYSDRPQPGAETVELREAQGYEPPQYNYQPPTRAGAGQQTEDLYTTVEILQPTEDEVVWNAEGQISVAVQVSPRLQPGHALQIYYDGQPAGGPSRGGGSFQLQNVWRGTHTLEAAVVDQDGLELMRGRPRTFHVRQTSTQNPANPQVKPPQPPPPPGATP